VQQDQTPFTYNGVSRQAIRQVAVSPIVDMTGANTWQGLTQIIEGVHCYDLIGCPIAVSFLFMASVSGTFSCALRTTQGTAYSYVANFSAVSGVPKKVTVLMPAIPAGATIANGTGNGLILHIGGLQSGSNMCPTGSLNAWQASQYYCGQGFTNWGAGANNWISASEVQLEAGSVATPYERRMFPMEFILCQRYYESGTCLIQLPAAAAAIQNIKFATYKRAVPTMVTSNQNYSSASAMQSNGVYQDSFGMQLTASAASGYGSCGWAASCEL
jgi:hypothetical protein